MVAENASGSLARRYVHGPGIDEPLLRYEGSGTTDKTWLYVAHLGSISARADSTGTSTGVFTYSPYGEQSMATVSFGYTGQQKFAEVWFLLQVEVLLQIATIV